MGAFLAPGRAQLDDRAGLERDVELRGRLVLPRGFGGEVADADIELTAEGKAFVEADILTSKKLFATAAATRAPLVRAIVRALETTKDGTLSERFFLDLLRDGFSEDEAQAQLDTAIDWGRYGELFDYRAGDGQLILTPADDMAA